METRLKVRSFKYMAKKVLSFFRYLKKKKKHVYFSKMLEVEFCVRITRKTKQLAFELKVAENSFQ